MKTNQSPARYGTFISSSILTGIDLVYTGAMEAFKAAWDKSLLPSPSLVERYDRGEYGEKTGKGWCDYEK